MINPFQEVNWHPDVRAKRKFALSLILGFPCVAAFLLLVHWLGTGAWEVPAALKLIAAGSGAGAVFWLIPAIAGPFYRGWFLVSCCVGIVISNFLMMAFYFLILTGVGLLMRARSRRPFQKGFKKDVASYWENVEKVADLKRYYSQF